MSQCTECGTNFVGTPENPPQTGLCKYCEIKQLRAKFTAAERERDEWRERCIQDERDLAIAGVRGSPPPGQEATIPMLLRQRQEADKERDSLAAKVRDLEWDIDAYRGAFGYSVPADHTGKLRDGATPQCGICNSEWHKNLEAKCAEMRDSLLNCSPMAEYKTLEWDRLSEQRKHALSPDCGRDYVPRRELDAEKAKVAEYQRVLNILKDDPAAVWTNMLRGMIARPAALDHYEECKAELEKVKAALKECVEALENYGNHRAHCQLGYSDQKCNCGFCEALAKAKEVLNTTNDKP